MGFLKKAVESFRRKITDLANRPCERKMSAVHKKYFENLYKQGVIQNALNVGQKVPDFDVIDCFGNKISIKERLQQGPLVLKFFRGTWCQFCATDLQFLSDNYEEITSLGATAVAVSAMPHDLTLKTATEGKFQFPLVADTQVEVGKKFGLVIRIPEELTTLYKENYGVDLSQYFGGKKDIDVILPSTYVINQEGVIVYTFLEEDFRKRADITEVLRVIKKAKIDAKKYQEKVYERECEIQAFVKSVVKKVVHRQSSSFSLFKKKEKLTTSDSDLLPKMTGSDGEKDPFGYALQHEDFNGSFKEYLQKTFCTENLLFYFEAASFNNSFASRTDEENRSHANVIFDTFVRIGSDLEVNIDDVTREKIVADLKQGLITMDLFSEAAKEVYHLMESDSYSKWKRTKEYAEVWRKNGSLEFLSPAPGFAAEAA